jgi:hypothetical protein
MTLAEILAPTPLGRFKLFHVGLRPLHAQGRADRLSALAPETPATGLALKRLLRDMERELDAPTRLTDGAFDEGTAPLEADHFVLVLAGAASVTLIAPGAEPDAEPVEPMRIELAGGDVLYLPRSWRAEPMRPLGAIRSMAIEVRQPNGRDLLNWMLRQFEANPFLDQDLPRFAPPRVQAEYLTGLRRTLAQACRTPGLLPMYSQGAARHAPPREPLAPTSSLGSERGGVIDFLPARRLAPWRPDPETIAFKFAGVERRFPIEAAELLAFLDQEAPVAMDSFCDTFDSEFERADLVAFVDELTRHGLAAMIEP